MDDCNSELESTVPTPPLIEPVHSNLGMICPCVSVDGSQGFVAIGVDYSDAGGDYALAFVS